MALILTEQEAALWLEGGWSAWNMQLELQERVWRQRLEGIVRIEFIDGAVAFRVDSVSGEVF